MAMLMLAGNFLWPVWAKTHEKDENERRILARRFSTECLRLSLHGSMKAEHFPDIVEQLEALHRDRQETKPPLRAV
jgi:hypothetical protein